MNNAMFSFLARKIVYDYAHDHLDKTDDVIFPFEDVYIVWSCKAHDHLDKTDDVIFPFEDVYIVWSCKTLQNNKAMISTNLPDGMYYEVTYNGDKNEFYLDAYKKFHNECIHRDDIREDLVAVQ